MNRLPAELHLAFLETCAAHSFQLLLILSTVTKPLRTLYKKEERRLLDLALRLRTIPYGKYSVALALGAIYSVGWNYDDVMFKRQDIEKKIRWTVESFRKYDGEGNRGGTPTLMQIRRGLKAHRRVEMLVAVCLRKEDTERKVLQEMECFSSMDFDKDYHLIEQEEIFQSSRTKEDQERIYSEWLYICYYELFRWASYRPPFEPYRSDQHDFLTITEDMIQKPPGSFCRISAFEGVLGNKYWISWSGRLRNFLALDVNHHIQHDQAAIIAKLDSIEFSSDEEMGNCPQPGTLGSFTYGLPWDLTVQLMSSLLMSTQSAYAIQHMRDRNWNYAIWVVIAPTFLEKRRRMLKWIGDVFDKDDVKRLRRGWVELCQTLGEEVGRSWDTQIGWDSRSQESIYEAWWLDMVESIY